MVFIVKGIVNDVRIYRGIMKNGFPYSTTIITIGNEEFSFFNLHEGILTEKMEIEFVCVQRGKYVNAINRTLRILKKSTSSNAYISAEIRMLSSR